MIPADSFAIRAKEPGTCGSLAPPFFFCPLAKEPGETGGFPQDPLPGPAVLSGGAGQSNS